MKFSRLSLAVLACSAGAVQAQGVEHLSGASAPRNNVVIALNNLCAGGNMVLYKDSAGVTNPGNIFTARCTSGNFTGTAVQEARFNVNGGSINSVLASVSASSGYLGYINAVSVPAGCAATPVPAAANGTGVMTGVRIVAACGTSGLTALTPSLGGYSDTEGTMFSNAGIALPAAGQVAANYVATPFNQGFGVAASKRLYEAMQEHQTAKGRLPALCAPLIGGVFTASGLSTPECQPSISRADYAALSATGNNVAKRAGANFLIGGLPLNGITTGNPAAATASDLGAGVSIASPLATATGKRIHLCRRVETSGTQSASMLYFLNRPTGLGPTGGNLLPAGLGSAGTFSSIDSATGTLFTARSNSGSGDAANCVNGNPTSDANPTPTAAGVQPNADPLPYALGVLSLENNPVPTANYRFLKINNQFGSEGAAGASQTAESIAGRYDFWFQLVKYCPSGPASCASILNAIDGAVVTGAGSPGIFRTTESAYTRGGASNPTRTK
jgi:hypothetical protein